MNILIVGVGNEYRSDDAAGLIVARQLREKPISGVSVLEQGGEGAALIEAWKGSDVVIIVDAVHSGARPGTIHRFNAHTESIPTNFFHYSSHAFSVAEAIELARTLNQLPPALIVYGIEGKTFDAGTNLSPEVNGKLKGVLERIHQDIQAFR